MELPAAVPIVTVSPVARDDKPNDANLLSPFPAWQPEAGDEQQLQGEPQMVATTTPARVRPLRSSPSAASSIQQSLSAPGQHQQQQQRQKLFNLRDGVREAISDMKKLAEAKQMVVADALYGFYNTEINLHFLHALSAYFMRVAKDVTAARRRKLQELSPQTGSNEPEQGCHREGNEGRAALLREVGRSYGRVIMYCSNFERTTADALFFESLLRLARMVVASAVAEPSLAPAVDVEFDRILRGGVFHPTPVRPVPRPPVRRRHQWALQSPPKTPLSRSNLFSRPGSRPPRDSFDPHPNRDKHDFDRDEGDTDDFTNKGSSDGTDERSSKRRGVYGRGEVRTASPASVYGGITAGIARGAEKKTWARSAEPGRRTASPVEEQVSSRDSARDPTSFTPPARPKNTKNREGRGSGGIRGNASLRTMPLSRHHNNSSRGGGVQNRLGDSTRATEPPPGNAGKGNAPPFPAFDELSRWRVTRGSVSRMVRQAGEAQRVALSNLGLAEGYRKDVAIKFLKKPFTAVAAAAAAATTTATTTATKTAFAPVGQPAQPMVRPERDSPVRPADSSSKNDHIDGDQQSRAASKAETTGRAARHSRSPSAAAADGVGSSGSGGSSAATGGKASFWKRRGRALTSRRERDGGGAPSQICGGQVQKDFFCADTLSVCIASVVDS